MTLPAAARRPLLIALLLAAAAAGFRLPRLGFPDEEIFDEVYHAEAARSYLAGQTPVEWVHPPTSKVLIAVGVWLFGFQSWAWRLAPALAGILLAPVFYALALRALRSQRAALIASFLLLCDGVYLVQSRTAMTNIFAVLFQVASALFVLRAVLPERLAGLDTLAAGLSIGLALSSRWTSLWAAGFLGLVILAVRQRRLLALRELLLLASCLGIVPLLVYAGSYWIFPAIRPTGIRHLVETTEAMWHYHATLQAEHHYFSRWYTWPLLYRPTWYFYRQAGDDVYGIVALGNPLLWWASVPVTLWALVAWYRRRDPRLLFSGLGFCCLYLPWGASPRTLNFSHYLFEALPYACLSLGVLLDQEWDGRFGDVCRGYLLAVLALFLFFFPLLTALPVPTSLFYLKLGPSAYPWIWFPSWI